MAASEASAMILRFRDPAGVVRVGVLRDGIVHACEGETVGSLIAADEGARGSVLERAALDGTRWRVDEVSTLAPIDGRMEVWACGVTYVRSRDARMAESHRTPDIYDRVYDAERPEIFFKSAAWRVVGPGGTVTVRRDSAISVPEPELAVVLDPAGRPVGLTICNDMSSRDIEGDNPLYLPQAKIWLGACALGPGIVLLQDVDDPFDLAIDMTIHRDGSAVFEGSSSSAQLHRRFEDLARWAYAEDAHPEGMILSTGTGIVPELSFTLQPGDRIEMRIEGIGTLSTPVGLGRESWIA
jgi:2-dehydro-3-deoxy-D-arabinonate dehydratase